MSALLEVRGLRLEFNTAGRSIEVLRGVDLTLERGGSLALVGESGSGKSVTAQSLLRLLDEPPARITAGSIHIAGRCVSEGPACVANAVRGSVAGMVFQDPQSALHPCTRIGAALAAVVRQHRHCTWREAEQRSLELLMEVGLDAPQRRVEQWPHQLSGGLRQRVAIAMALAGDPQLLIADEPTTALDATVQARVLGLLSRLRAQRGLALLLITHDLGVVAAAADEMAVMYAGRIVEQGPVREVLAQPLHPYSQALRQALPRTDALPRCAPVSLRGLPPLPEHLPTGCAFHPRCSHALPACALEIPALVARNAQHSVACPLEGQGA